MNTINNGGPAFPALSGQGMTLRDYFAAKAMQAFFSDSQVLTAMAKGSRGPVVEAATAAYELADAMLKARDVQQ